MRNNFNLICSTIDAGIMVLDGELNVFFWNQWLENYTKIKSNSINGKNLLDYFVGVKTSTLKRKIKTALSLKSPTFYTTSEHGYLFEVKLNRLTDTVYNHMQQSITIMPYDLEKKLVVVYVYNETFLSEANYKLKLAKDELQESYEEIKLQKDEFQTIFDITKDGLAILDLESNFLKVNDAYCEITGLTKEEMLQTSCLALTSPDYIKRTKDAIYEVLENGFVKNLEKHCFIKNKSIVVNATLALVPSKQHILISIKDVTQIKKFEEQSKLISMGQMIGNIAHQWRQPLSVISTIASGVKVREEFGLHEGYNLLEDMNQIMIQSQYLSKTIDDFKNFIKTTSNKSKISINETIDKTISIVISSLQNNHIKLILNISDDAILPGYENELIQSFINIINNAKDAVVANVKEDDDKFIFIKTIIENECLTLDIKDSGGGIDPHIMHRIFEPYFSTKHQSVGTGIGLSLCRQIITEHHDATIEAFNSEFLHDGKSYKGACFRIVFFLS